jgi:hypothetical protein
VTNSSSTRRAAKLAQRGKGRKVRFQGGTVFPAAVALVLVLGMALIAYSRQSLPAADDSPPTIEDHWHAAYGFYLCDDWYQLSGNLEELTAQGTLANTGFLRTGVHSHDDGVMHWHAYTSASVGKNAVIDVFLDNYGVELTDDTLSFPDDFSMINPDDPSKVPMPVASEWIEGETQCNGEDAEVSVVSWNLWSDLESDGDRYNANMNNNPVTNDGMAFAIMFAPRDAGKIKPPTFDRLDELGAVDMGGNAPNPGDFVDDGGSVVTLAEAQAYSVPAESAPAGSTPVTTGG